MAALETNVLVRFLVGDDAAQAAAATGLIQRSVAARENLFVPITVALELEWVLRSKYGFAKADIRRTFGHLLSASEVVFQHEKALEFALQLWQKESADFSDCIHIALAAESGNAPMWTFDKGAASLSGARRLK